MTSDERRHFDLVRPPRIVLGVVERGAHLAFARRESSAARRSSRATGGGPAAPAARETQIEIPFEPRAK